jgi:TolB-like protein
MNPTKFFAELKRRNVYKVAVAYIVGGWALSEGISQVFPVFNVPNGIIRLIVILITAGLPVALVLAWMFEITPEGIKRTATADAMPASAKPKKYTWLYVVVIGAVVSIGLFSLGRYSAINGTPRQDTSAARTEAATVPNKSIAVLPFSDLSPNHDQESFSDGMAEEILNALAHIKDLKVVGRASSFFYKGKNVNLKQIGSELGVANILEGSVRKQGEVVRITAALSRAADGLQVWSKNYNGTLANIFDLQ